MAAKLGFVAACLGLVALASGSFLGSARPKMSLEEAIKHVDEHIAQEHMWKGLEPEDLNTMESTIETLVTKGDDPATRLAVKTMYSFITNTMIPNREKSQANDQSWLNSQFEGLENCHWDHQTKLDMNLHAKVESAADHKKHYKDSVAKHGECLGVLEGKKLVTDAYCAAVEDVEKLCHCDGRLVGLGSHPVDCKGAPKIAAKDKQCCDAYVEHAQHRAGCENAKYDAKYAQMQHKIIMTKVCKDYDTCYAARSRSYAVTEKSVKTAEELRDWTMLYKIQCLVGAFDKDGKVSQEEAQACKDKKYVVEGIKFPEVPAKAECNPEVDAYSPVR